MVSVNAACVPSVRALVPSPTGLAPPAPIDVLVLIHARTEAANAAVAPTVPAERAWFWSRIVSMSRLSDLPFLADLLSRGSLSALLPVTRQSRLYHHLFRGPGARGRVIV